MFVLYILLVVKTIISMVMLNMTKSCRLNSFQAEIATNSFDGIPLCDLRVYNSNGFLKTSVNIAARLRKPSRANNTPVVPQNFLKELPK